jgi:outer membrane protein OmpA-like peptidoglycan-associated protein
MAVLDKGAALLQTKEYSVLKVQIAGYTDNRGKQNSNKRISQERADAVKVYLVSKGVDASRITADRVWI